MFGRRKTSSVNVVLQPVFAAASPAIAASPTVEEQAAAGTLQRVTRGNSARRLRRQMTDNLQTQRSVAMDLLSSEIEYLQALTKLQQQFEPTLRKWPAADVPAEACDALFSSIPSLIVLHRKLITAVEEIAGCTSSGRRLAAQLLIFTAPLSELYVPYARQWAVNAEHMLKTLEANQHCAKVIGAHGGGGGGGEGLAAASAEDGDAWSSVQSMHAAMDRSSRASVSLPDVSDALGDHSPPASAFPRPPLGFGGSELRSLLELPLRRISAYEEIAVELQLACAPTDPSWGDVTRLLDELSKLSATLAQESEELARISRCAVTRPAAHQRAPRCRPLLPCAAPMRPSCP
jgi:hypothetical protein